MNTLPTIGTGTDTPDTERREAAPLPAQSLAGLLADPNDERQGAPSCSYKDQMALCPPSWYRQQGLPDLATDEEQAMRLKGNRIHEVQAGQRNASELTAEETATLEALRANTDKFLFEVGASQGGAKMKKALSEQRFWSGWNDPDLGEVRYSGRVDLFVDYTEFCVLVDYKSGAAHALPADSSLQLRGLVCLLDEAGLLNGRLVHAAIVTPLGYTHCTYEQEAIRFAAGEIKWLMTRNLFAPYMAAIPGEWQCRYCRAKTVCPEHQAWVAGLLPVLVPAALPPKIDDWKADDCARFCAGEPIASRWLENTKALMRDRLKADPDAIPGWELSPPGSRRTIADMQACYERTLAHGVKPEEFVIHTKIGLGDLESLVRKATGLKGKELESAVTAILSGIIETKATEPSLRRKK